MSRISLIGPQHPIRAELTIGGSKSISNRALLIKALCQNPFTISNLSDSDDTRTMSALLSEPKEIYDAHHAGTTYRFLTAFFAINAGTQILTGSDRMKERPIGPLVEALRTLGAEIDYLEKEYYPPLRIKSFKSQEAHEIEIASDISSQYLSALCMIAPVLPKGLKIKLQGDLVSKPYLKMTLQMMQDFGVKTSFENTIIKIDPQDYIASDYLVESDWSSASYLYSIVSLLKKSEIKLNYFFENSMQGDSAISKMADAFGVNTQFLGNSIVINSNKPCLKEYEYNFIEQPDIAQTISVMAAAHHMKMHYSGLKTLYIKETNRVEALKKELSKIHVSLDGNKETDAYIQKGKILVDNPVFDTYKDHRMAMAFAPLSILNPIEINEHMVVTKSYPKFWKDLETLGFKLMLIE